jgi:formylglycine-generating enzyme required for sulfatase activity
MLVSTTPRDARRPSVRAALAALALVAGSAVGPGCGGPQVRRPADLASMVHVPAGEFGMGRDGGASDEGPARRVWLDEFWIDRLEVTNAQYKAFCDATGRLYPPTPVWDPDYFNARPDHPVININWEQARDYCAWAGKRLPTEAEWEKAAGGGARLYPWGDDWVVGRANLARGDAHERAAPVDAYPEDVSPYGVQQMAGNVREWVADAYDPAYYAGAPARNPTGPAAATATRALRGGGFTSPQADATTFNRQNAPQRSAIHHVGCRCAWSPQPLAAPAP